MTQPDTGASKREQTKEPTASCPIDPDEKVEEGESGLSNSWIRKVWSAGSYAEIAPQYAPMAGRLVERTEVSGDEVVLDVGCGTGTAAITAAGRGAQVTGVDITPVLLEQARENAQTAGLEDVSWREGDATALPFEDDSFEVALSNLGHMYGDPPEDAARELLRVVRPDGRIGFTAWTPGSLFPSMGMAAMGVLSPADLPDLSEPPFLWGDPDVVQKRLGGAVESLVFETGTVWYPALSPQHFWEQTARTSGMFIELIDGVDDTDRQRLHERMIDTIDSHFDRGRNAVELEYRLATASVK